eukprot:TRINITY_DN5058_c0_g2_i1.p2 TRINITY_DN5058_c0_g2~~TRINITY_DN5058_c0_g2_i1.p2  ORF type:complete len:104 (+),score=10.50 TRINITY_DN5058_c0_g2_i1:220-531(+)
MAPSSADKGFLEWRWNRALDRATSSFSQLPKLKLDIQSACCVRGTIRRSGFLLQPNDLGTKVTYMFQVDGAGWIPQAAMNQAQKYQPLGILGIRKILTGSPKP